MRRADAPRFEWRVSLESGVTLTRPRFLGQPSVENPTVYGTCEFDWDPYSRANSAGVFHASAEWGRSSL